MHYPPLRAIEDAWACPHGEAGDKRGLGPFLEIERRHGRTSLLEPVETWVYPLLELKKRGLGSLLLLARRHDLAQSWSRRVGVGFIPS